MKDLFKHDAVTDRPLMMQWFNKEFRYGNGQDSRGLIFRSVKHKFGGRDQSIHTTKVIELKMK